jgi:hypothetical protein
MKTWNFLMADAERTHWVLTNRREPWLRAQMDYYIAVLILPVVIVVMVQVPILVYAALIPIVYLFGKAIYNAAMLQREARLALEAKPA